MKNRMIALGLCTLLLSGCYTVVLGPRTVADLDREPSVAEEQEQYEASTLGRFDPYEDGGYWDDYYRYPGAPGGYGYGGYGYGGYPSYGIGYRSDYGYYGYGPYPYYGYYGYGPYSYGYDPYYQGSTGYYIPVGYELVTEQELNDLYASRRALVELQEQLDPAEQEQRRQERLRQEEEAWLRRVEPQMRDAPAPTPRATTTSSSSSSTYSAPATGSKASSSDSGSAKSSQKPSAKPKKRRR